MRARGNTVTVTWTIGGDKLTKSTAISGTIASIVAAAATWFILDVIIGIAVWISFVAGGGVLIAGTVLAVGAGAARASGDTHRPHPGSPLGAG